MNIGAILSWLFGTREGVITMLAICLVGFLIAAIILERKTRRDYDKYDDGDEDAKSGWSFFDDDNQ